MCFRLKLWMYKHDIYVVMELLGNFQYIISWALKYVSNFLEEVFEDTTNMLREYLISSHNIIFCLQRQFSFCCSFLYSNTKLNYETSWFSVFWCLTYFKTVPVVILRSWMFLMMICLLDDEQYFESINIFDVINLKCDNNDNWFKKGTHLSNNIFFSSILKNEENFNLI